MPYINHIFLCPTLGELPTGYTASLSFEEQLLKLNRKINEIIDQLNQISIEQIKQLIDAEINNLKNYVDNQDNLIYNYIDEQIIETKLYTDEEIAKLNSSLITLINQKINMVITMSKTDDEILRLKFFDEIQKINERIDNISINDLKIYNPVRGYKTSIEKAVMDLYNVLRYQAITAGEFDNLELTCKQYDNLSITAIDFDLYSKTLLIKNYVGYMFNPFTGIYEPFQKVIYTLADFHRENPLTAKEFDSLELTATTFDDTNNLTAYIYDFNGKSILSA